MTGWLGFFVLSAVSLAVLAVIQAVTFAVGRRIGRYNVVDVAWGAGFVAVALLALVVGGGDPTRRWVLAALVTVWGLRLSWHMVRKSAGRGEDPRYTELLARTDGSIGAVIRKVFATQGISQWFVSLPIQVSAVVAGGTGPLGRSLLIVGTVVCIFGFVFESVGDAQLRRFKDDPGSRGQIMDGGLWAWTRHPNYFGDSCVWWGIWLIAAGAWPAALTIASPVAMTYFLVYATGARLLERSMSSRPGYREYQLRTSYFLPRPPRRLADRRPQP
ncbi:DUF1295 domain-containing protein [Gordonia sp. ABSL1-1]|uniref:DUF1295 domain-containing protein n=1 Tax=Gordonia sp. ABSL1-1 TaxID=3053923 RepID=UPI0025733A7D|nr:DUF1295 domain-containing protein [Gordonia sp. ABSL1-1]MDL9935412.1 DUF1295 domain-containing protein [Gordonia sp. ABSL1-1]